MIKGYDMKLFKISVFKRGKLDFNLNDNNNMSSMIYMFLGM